MKQLALFDPRRPDKYPESPGYKKSGTSKDAAQAVRSKVSGLRAKILLELSNNGPGTADEIAERLGLSILAIRPRFSELCHMGAIAESGERRTNSSGKLAAVWKKLKRL